VSPSRIKARVHSNATHCKDTDSYNRTNKRVRKGIQSNSDCVSPEEELRFFKQTIYRFRTTKDFEDAFNKLNTSDPFEQIQFLAKTREFDLPLMRTKIIDFLSKLHKHFDYLEGKGKRNRRIRHF
jgi:hypothetical protein